MPSGVLRPFAGVAAFALASCMSASVAFAVCAPLPQGATATPSSQLLPSFPNGGPALSSEVRNIVASNPEELAGIVGLIPAANVAQRSAIGAGLGQAAGVCNRPDPDTARRIQEAVIAAANPEMLASFQEVTGDRQTTAVAGGGGRGGSIGGGGTVGSSASGNGGSYLAPSTLSYPNSTGVFSGGGGAFTGLATGSTVSTLAGTSSTSQATP